ncbi:MAG: hypothetical protein MZW92_70265 [Comamonadaceae bacterium]|nr:hypothetical protein [Comamonadaceae bacterium]
MRPLRPDGSFELLTSTVSDERAPHQRRAATWRLSGRAAHRPASRTRCEAGVLLTRYRGALPGPGLRPGAGTGSDRRQPRVTRARRPATPTPTPTATNAAPSGSCATRMTLRRRLAACGPGCATRGCSARACAPADGDDGLRATDYDQSVTTPWLALACAVGRRRRWLYASWGQGLETDVAPNRARYTNAGEPLPALKSRQVELGLQARSGAGVDAGAGAVRHRRARMAADIGACDVRRQLHAARSTAARATAASRRRPTLARRRRGAGAPARCGSTPSAAASAQPARQRHCGPTNVPGAQPAPGRRLPRRRRCPAWRCRPTWRHESDRVVLPDDERAHPRLGAAGPRRALDAARWRGHDVVWRAGRRQRHRPRAPGRSRPTSSATCTCTRWRRAPGALSLQRQF